MTPDQLENQTYYQKHKKKLLRMYHDFMDNYFKQYFTNKYPDTSFQDFKKKTLLRYDQLIPTIPYIGGFKNKYTMYLIGAPLVIALYDTLQPLGITDEEFGEIIFEPLGDYLSPHNVIQRWLARFLINHGIAKRMLKKRSQKPLIYDHEWKIEVIEDKTDPDLLYVMKYTKCGLYEYMKEQGYQHLTPFLCLVDYRTIGNIGVGFARTQTIAMGGNYCDFQFRRKKRVPNTWNPQLYQEYQAYLQSKQAQEQAQEQDP